MTYALLPNVDGSDFKQEFFVVESFPDVIRVGFMHPFSVFAHALKIQYAYVVLLQLLHILRRISRVAHHRLIFLLRAAVIALTAAAVGVHGIAVNIHGLIKTLRARHCDDDDVVAVDLLDSHVTGGENIHAGEFWIAYNLPEFAHKLLGVWQIDRMKRLVLMLHHAEQNDSAKRIRKGRVRLPDAVRQTTESALRLYSVVLPVLFKMIQVDHVLLLSKRQYSSVHRE